MVHYFPAPVVSTEKFVFSLCGIYMWSVFYLWLLLRVPCIWYSTVSVKCGFFRLFVISCDFGIYELLSFNNPGKFSAFPLQILLFSPSIHLNCNSNFSFHSFGNLCERRILIHWLHFLSKYHYLLPCILIFSYHTKTDFFKLFIYSCSLNPCFSLSSVSL